MHDKILIKLLQLILDRCIF